MDKPTILCVDDEENILKALKRMFRREGCQVITTTSAKEGLEILENETIHVVLSDQRMPEMSGTEFLHHVKEHYPETIRIILSGYAEINAVIEAINEGEVFRFILKPWEDDKLKETISDCIKQYTLKQQNNALTDLLESKEKELAQLKSGGSAQSSVSPNLFQDCPLPILYFDAAGALTEANAAAQALYTRIKEGRFSASSMPEPVQSLLEQSAQDKRFYQYYSDSSDSHGLTYHVKSAPGEGEACQTMIFIEGLRPQV